MVEKDQTFYRGENLVRGDLTFRSGRWTTRGWQAALAGYQERYATREKMWRLALCGLEITPLGDATAVVIEEVEGRRLG